MKKNELVDKEGLSPRCYAAIKLKVPDSGEDWLDAMIIKANRKELALAAMQEIMSNNEFGVGHYSKQVSDWAYSIADEMLKQ